MPARGRHRRPQPPTRLSQVSVAVTAGGATVALPLLGTHAEAASPATWDKVAACESSGDWDINTGNGTYGGLWFTESTWKSYGGPRFASRADLATRRQRIAVAENVLEARGPGARPVCSTRAGLSKNGDRVSRSARRPAAPEAEPKTRTESGPEGSPGKGRKEPEDKNKAADKDRTEDGRKGKDRDGDGDAPGGHVSSYRVTRGDTLSGIAEDHTVAGGWPRLYDVNRDVVGSDPNLILPGQRLTLPREVKRSGTKSPAEPAPKATRSRETPPKQAPAEEAPAKKAPVKQAPVKQAPVKQQAAPSASHVTPVSGPLGTRYGISGSLWASGHHTGQDFPVPIGTSVRSVASGTVVSAGWGGAYGYQVVVRHGDGRYTSYAHLSSVTVRVGQGVGAGKQVGRAGSTGNTTGPHLHFEVRTGPGYGSDIDPLAYLRSHGVDI